jgi:hypothetical protein
MKFRPWQKAFRNPNDAAKAWGLGEPKHERTTANQGEITRNQNAPMVQAREKSTVEHQVPPGEGAEELLAALCRIPRDRCPPWIHGAFRL